MHCTWSLLLEFFPFMIVYSVHIEGEPLYVAHPGRGSDMWCIRARNLGMCVVYPGRELGYVTHSGRGSGMWRIRAGAQVCGVSRQGAWVCGVSGQGLGCIRSGARVCGISGQGLGYVAHPGRELGYVAHPGRELGSTLIHQGALCNKIHA